MIKVRRSRFDPSSSSSSSDSDDDNGRQSDGESDSSSSSKSASSTEEIKIVDGIEITPVEVMVEMVPHGLVDVMTADIEVTLMPRIKIAQELAKLEKENPRTCLFKLLVDDCPGVHEDTLSMVKCVAKALDYEPFNCWWCHHQWNGIVNNCFSNYDDLMDHQDKHHSRDVPEIGNKFAYFGLINRVKEALIRCYIEVRNGTVTIDANGERKYHRTIEWFERRMASRTRSEEWKRNLFCTEFGYTPLVCKLCLEKWIKEDRPRIFGIGAMNEEGEQLANDHMQRYHSLSLNRCSDLDYWFEPRSGRIERMEDLFQKFMDRAAVKMQEPVIIDILDHLEPISPAGSDLIQVIERSDSDRDSDDDKDGRSSVTSGSIFNVDGGEGPEGLDDSEDGTKYYQQVYSPSVPTVKVIKCGVRGCSRLLQRVDNFITHHNNVHGDGVDMMIIPSTIPEGDLDVSVDDLIHPELYQVNQDNDENQEEGGQQVQEVAANMDIDDRDIDDREINDQLVLL